MTQRIFASFAAIAVIFAVSVSSSSAQTAGVSSLEQVGYMMKQSYGFSLNREGSVLTLRNLGAANDVVTLTQVGHNDLVLQTVIGNLNSLPKAKQTALRETISFLNTSLPVGTIVIGTKGEVAMEHHLNPGLVSPAGMTMVVARFSAEAGKRRAQLFS